VVSRSVERMLFYSGVTSSIGDVDKGNTVTDFLPMERERGITIASAAISFSWKQHRFNLVDTPGHVDFTVEVERSVRVLDGAVAILDAVQGVQAQTETVWKQANRYNVPRIAFVNKYDREGASLARTMSMMTDRLGARPLALQLPIGQGIAFRGVIDVLRLEALEWTDATGSTMKSRVLSPQSDAVDYDSAVKARTALFESLSEVDEVFLERYLSVVESAATVEGAARLFSDDLHFVHKCIRRATIAMHVVPCFVGAAFRNKGVQPVMDGVIAYLPSPLDVHTFPIARNVKSGASVKLAPDDKAELVCLAWKVVHHEQMGLLTYFRIMSGTLNAGKPLINTGVANSTKERPNKLVILHAGDMEQVAKVTAGNIGALVGLKHVSTGDTLMYADCKSLLVLPGVSVPPPVFFRSIEPQSLAEQQKLDDSLALLHLEDPSFQISVDKDTGQVSASV
jgi:elongation factor G